MNKTLEQERADRAFKVVNNQRKNKKEDKEKYAQIVKRLPAMIMNSGLGQTLAYLLADNEGKNKPSGQLYQDISEWIKERVYERKNESLIEILIREDSSKYMHAQQEALALLGWMKRFSEAFLGE